METMKVPVALFHSSLEHRGGINVRSFILNVSQLIGVKYETRLDQVEKGVQNNSIVHMPTLLVCKIGITGAVRVQYRRGHATHRPH